MFGLKRCWSAVTPALSLGLVVTWTAGAQAQEGDAAVQECATAYEQAQVSRNGGKLLVAQEQLRLCVRDACPDFVRTDCGQWLSEVGAEIPSVIFAAVGAGETDLVDVKVTVDGQLVTESLDGRAVELDPGRHTVVFEHQGKLIEKPLVIRQGEKNRVVRVEIKLDVDTDGDGLLDRDDRCPDEVGTLENNGCAAKAPVAPAPAAKGPNWMRIGAYAGFGVGALGGIGFAYYGLKQADDEKNAPARCQQLGCTDEVQAQLIAENDDLLLKANISLGVCLLGVATGTTLFILSMDRAEPEQRAAEGVQVDVASLPGGGMFSLSGQF